MAIHYDTVRLETVGSTQDEARLRLAAADDAVLVVAERQVDGRGRSGRQWVEAPRAMYSSLALRPTWPRDTWPRITLCTGVAVADAVEQRSPMRVRLKWPNDLRTDTGKVAGILVEAQDDMVVIGCGVNLWWPPGPERPSDVDAVFPDDPGPDAAVELAQRWVDGVSQMLAGHPDAWPVETYRRRCETLGQDVEWEPSGEGRAVDVAPDGGLIVDTTAGPTTLYAGEVRSVRPVHRERGSAPSTGAAGGHGRVPPDVETGEPQQ